MENYETVFVSELKFMKYPFPQGSISNFTNISIKKINKSITSIKSFPNFHKHSFQIPSNLTISIH